MLTKIISSGQTGADRAALDVAIEFEIPHGGWTPKGRKTEDGILPDKYRLQEMPTASYSKRTEQNVIDSDGTLILSHGKLTGGSALTMKLAENHHRPYLHIDFTRSNGFEAARAINSWIVKHGVKVLNVAGARASKDSEIYDATFKALTAAFHLALVESSTDKADRFWHKPKTVDEAVDRMMSVLTLKDRVRIARMGPEEAGTLPITLGDYIWVKFGLRDGNDELMESCRLAAGTEDLPKESAIDVITKAVWENLKETHALRPVN